MTNYKKSLENQILGYPPEEQPYDFLKIISYTAFGGMLLLSVGLLFESCTREPMPTVTSRVMCHECHHFTKIKVADKNKKMVNYFRAKGSKYPKEMADAINGRTNKRLLAAISIVETKGNPKVRGGGYKKRHHGAFQVNPEFWGNVPKDAAGQARQAEAILAELTGTMSLQKALNSYGGDTRGKYAVMVLNELKGVPR